MSDVLRITDTSSRADIELAIRTLRAKQERMPDAWVDRRAGVADEIDGLVDLWLLADE